MTHPDQSERKHLVMDMDGTICEQTWNNTYHLAKPVQDVIDKVNDLYDAGWHVTIYTARGMRTCKGDVKEVERRYKVITEEWLLKHQVMYHRLVFGKPPGDLYVDDRGMTPSAFVAHIC
jgi:capsule biosynthesis phosphatase